MLKERKIYMGNRYFFGSRIFRFCFSLLSSGFGCWGCFSNIPVGCERNTDTHSRYTRRQCAFVFNSVSAWKMLFYKKQNEIVGKKILPWNKRATIRMNTWASIKSGNVLIAMLMLANCRIVEQNCFFCQANGIVP